MRTPVFSKCMNLKRLVIKDCKLLEEINSSIGQLGRLKCLEIIEEPCLQLEPQCSLYFNSSTAPVPLPLLPDSIGGLKSLSMLKVEHLISVEVLPHSIGELLGLKHLSLRGCALLTTLPNSVGQLRSLLCLDLSGTNISELPYSIGRTKSLLKMDLSRTNIAELPSSIGNLKQLKFMCLDWTKIRELPKSIWTLENLEQLTARGCQNLEGEIPSEIAGLSQLKILNLSQSKVSGVPMTLDQLSNLRELVLTNCNGLQSIPDLPTSLTKLELSSSSLQQYPKLEWLGRLHELQTLRLVLSDFNLPPTDMSSLSQLRSLELTCPDPRSLTRLPSSLEDLCLEDVRTPIEWPLFSNLGNLSELKLFGCQLREIEFDSELGQLENLRRLQVRKCESLVRLSNLSSLKELRMLSVEYCPKLIEIKSQPSSTGDCGSTKRLVPDTLKLEKLQSLRVYYCESVLKLPDIPKACETEFIGRPWENKEQKKRGGCDYAVSTAIAYDKVIKAINAKVLGSDEEFFLHPATIIWNDQSAQSVGGWTGEQKLLYFDVLIRLLHMISCKRWTSWLVFLHGSTLESANRETFELGKPLSNG
ncbi:hypothetical protein NL676_033322 [Syzygium grande]|nr:hypothetical protein NL676_033322 [Syzygium grande]